ncbi:PepSY-associated TM helix domain-containing protein [Sphingobacterium thalpophilum]|uniref:PepSY-associated TM helix domain-containing protein n=1 Tax=Sphingobacterium thalpophilum TaxID=259 RepID=UPI0024A77830|nr:PepSY-associated TM helix domain-containing protein [Sphingobacterium thalpophilum]
MMKGIKNTFVFLHRWLGLISGAIVLVICLTGALLVFEKDIRSFTEPFQLVKASDQPMLAPGTIAKMVEKKTGKQLSNISYPGRDKSVVCTLKTAKRRSQSILIYVNPYSGKILKVKELEKDFFKWLITGHYYLWLPVKVGKIVVATATLVFLVLLISGLVLWFPGKRNSIKRSFLIKWRAKRKRLLYDLHNVLGFYSLLLLVVLSVSGLIFGFKWFDKAFYRLTSGGAEMAEMRKPSSEVIAAGAMLVNADTLFTQYMLPKILQGHVQTLYFPAKKKDAFMLYDNPDGDTRFRRNTRFFDQYSLEELHGKGAGFYAGNFEEASLADRLKRMNYDIHVGSVLGWPSKLMAFAASLVGVLLVVTGYWMWLGSRFKNRKHVPKKAKIVKNKTLERQI